ncbi:hypothetical protein G4V62_10015 [Bacillaceae bacterium SIJ1]|nr:hypothetical protein [Litoribacterium kuwaitense]
MDLHTYVQADATELADFVRQKEVTPKELLTLSIEQMEKVNPELNAVVHERKEKALATADESPSSGLFAGVPTLLKDLSHQLEGERMTSGSVLFQHMIAEKNAAFVDALLQAGLLPLGHTNTPEFGLKNITEPRLHGPARNPWNTDYSPGGSSGGAAAAIAAGIVPVAGASDGGGSIRIPASFTGLFGLKPTRGRTPVGPGVGRQWQGASIDFVLAKSVRDSAALLDVTQTIQPAAAFQTPLYPGVYRETMKEPIPKQLRIAYSTESPVGTPVSECAKRAVLKTAACSRNKDTSLKTWRRQSTA